jgi:hypothetical protein
MDLTLKPIFLYLFKNFTAWAAYRTTGSASGRSPQFIETQAVTQDRVGR